MRLKAIVEQLVECLNSSHYNGKSFGVVVLLSSVSHVKLLDNEIKNAVSPEVRQERKIRVGIPANFQGAERDVIFLSMVVASTPRASKAAIYQRAFNVAASRAADQMWLFTSVGLDQLNPEDLRASLLGYMLDPPSPYGLDKQMDDVREDEPHSTFDSLFEQRVFLEIQRRGFHVAPQYQVGDHRLDLVISGGNGRLAVECDGDYWHDDMQRDLWQDLELYRAGWDILRIRESEFEFDRDGALKPLWQRLERRGITPHSGPVDQRSATIPEWKPIELEEDD